MTDPLETHLLAQMSGRQVLFWHEVRALPVTTRLHRPDATVVDIGAGAGTLGDILLRDHPNVRYRFYEPLDSMADILEDRHGQSARLADASACADADIVTLLDVIEHVPEPTSMLAPIVLETRPGALLVITVPAIQFLWSSWDVELGHYRRYTKRSLKDAVRGLPIDIIEVSYLFPELLPAALARRILRRRHHETPGSEFPTMPPWLDRLLGACSRLTYRARRAWPAGTSVVLVARRR